jgi:hypothetical protein
MNHVGCDALAEALRDGVLPKFEVLDLAMNQGAGVRGVEAVGRALQACPRPRLKRLGLSYFDFENDGAEELFKALRAGACQNVRFLELNGNKDQDRVGEGGPGRSGVIVAQGLAQAMAAGALARLEILTIAANDVNDDHFVD